jgi:rubredoxin
MGQVIPRQHPAVVLRSHYKAVLGLLSVALVAIVALAATLVIVANNNDDATISAQPNATQQQALPPGTRFDGGPDEGTRGIQAAPVAPGTRFDGGPDEGTRGIQAAPVAPGTRFDGGPDEGTRGPQSSSSQPTPVPPVSSQGPGARP